MRYSTAVIVKSNIQQHIAEAIKKTWIAIFVAPRVTLSDNAGEFNNELFCEVCEQFNITMKSSGGSPVV